MSRHRILLQTDPTWVKTGLAENAKTLLSYLWKTGRYDIGHYTEQGTPTNHPQLGLTPWKSYGCIPMDQEIINRINADPLFGRNASYGSVLIDSVVRDFKPTIWIGSNDAWSFPTADYAEKSWFSRINSIHHITLDSVPITQMAFDQAKRSKIYLTWAKFAAKEMQRVGGPSMGHVSSLYGAMDTTLFSPIIDADKLKARKQFGLAPDTFIFLFVFRNQLRKSANRVLDAYARFRRENPHVKTALHFHTSFSEKGQGWDFPMMAGYYGIKPEELLCTYVCKECGAWAIAPFAGEDLKCPVCGSDKGLATASIMNGVPASQMRVVYGMSDACVSVFTSGGQEYHSVQSLLCGKPLACTNYSCGEDFCIPGVTDEFTTPLSWHPYDEAQSNFVKAATDVGAITDFMRTMVKSSKRDLQAMGEKGRAWAQTTFGIEAIGAQWEKVFAAMPTNADWSSIDLTTTPRKNPLYQPPAGMTDNIAWLKDIYKGILLMDVSDQDDGLKHWTDKLANGIPRTNIENYFRQVAQQENTKSGAEATVDFSTLLDKRDGRKRGLILIKESIGDIAMMTALFESFHEQHPDTDLYVATNPQYHEILAGNEHVYKTLPYIPAMEQELLMMGQGVGPRYFDAGVYHPAVASQRHLAYLSLPEPAFDVRQPEDEVTA